MMTDKQLTFNHLTRVIVLSLLTVGIILIGFSTPTTAIAQTEEPASAQAKALAAESGVAVELVAEMLAAGIPPAYINPKMAEQFEIEIRPELLLSAPNSSPVDGALMSDATAPASAPNALQNVRLRSCNSQNFPFVFLTVSVDNSGHPVPDLTQANFQCFENGILQTDLFQVTPPQSGDNVRLADIVFLIDASSSMADEIADVRTNVAAFANSLAASDIDYRLGLVQFGNNSGPNPFLFNSGNLTTDVSLFKRFIDSLGASGGFEPGFLALRAAVQGFNFRPGAQRVFVLISDEDSDDREYQATVDLLVANSITVHTAVDCNFDLSIIDYCNNTSVRGVTDGLLFNVVGPYNQILDTIAGSTADTYILRYQSSNPNFDATTRNVECRVTAPAVQGTVSCTYIPGAAPQIALTTETLALNQNALAEGSSPLIGVLVTDQAAPFVQTVTLYYRTTATTGAYSVIAMTNRGNNRYEATIPAVRAPGVDYYITATDSQVLSSLPSTDPGVLPFQIGVLPNVAPQILHTPLTNALYRADQTITADILDTTNRVAAVELKWRRPGELIYRTIVMQQGSGSRYSATIAGTEITTEFAYFIRAVDDLGVASTAGSADIPYRVPLIYGESPIIFIPGMAGSRLRTNQENEDLWLNLYEPDERTQLLLTYLETKGFPGAGDLLDLYNQRQDLAQQLTLDSSNPHFQNEVLTPDALRLVFGFAPIYGPILNALEINYPPYLLAGNPHQPGKSCDSAQAQNPDKPRLFVFPYDWRQSNVVNVNLLEKYIKDCIQRDFYPNSQIDIVAHSMGGLLARRYILNNPGTHDIDRLITIGTPWLGAPEFIKVLETGDWISIVKYAILKSNRLKALVETFPGAHELLPSDRYFQLIPGAFSEEGWDINGNGRTDEQYDANHYQMLMDQQRYPLYRPVEKGQDFHNYPGQDSWATDRSGVEYHYIVGVQAIPWTIERVKAKRICLMNALVCLPITLFAYDYGDGDGTVPLVSAQRARPADTPDGLNIHLHELHTSVLQRLEADHLGLVLSGAVQECIMNILRNEICPERIQPLAVTVGVDAATEQIDSTYHVTAVGIGTAIIEDEDGKRTGSYPDGLIVDNIDEAKYFPTGGEAFEALVAATQSYTLTFRTGTLPFTAEIIERTSSAVLTASRYRDIQLPPNTLVQILLNPQSDYHVRYDADNNGIPETELPGLVAGTGAQDTTAPQIAVHSDFAGEQLGVTITAQDSGSGVAAIYYSLDGVNFVRYSAPFQVARSQELIHVFADDNVSNRSALFTFPLIQQRYLPIISFRKPTPPANLKPNLPANPIPASGATVAGDSVTLQWSGGDPDGDVTTYDLYLDATGGVPGTLLIGNLSSTSHTVHGLLANTQYAWRIVARDSDGATESGPVWRFTTAPAAALEITISSSSTDQYKLQRKEDGNGLTAGSLVYSDRDYHYDTIASSVQGATYVATANNDKGEGGLRLMVTVNKPVQLYIAFSDRVTKKPTWLEPFQDTGEDLTFFSNTGNVVNLSLYRAVFPAGDIHLGENDPTSIGYTMYTIVIQE